MNQALRNKNRTFIRSRAYSLVATLAIVVFLSLTWFVHLNRDIEPAYTPDYPWLWALYLSFSGAMITLLGIFMGLGVIFIVAAATISLYLWTKGIDFESTRLRRTLDSHDDSFKYIAMSGLLCFALLCLALPGIFILPNVMEVLRSYR